MFGIGITEMILVAVVALLVVGPKNLPTALRSIGRAIGTLTRTVQSVRNEVGLDEVVNDVTRPLREGMADLQNDMLHAGDVAKKGEDTSREYPETGPDDYGALPENAAVYPEQSPVYGKQAALEKEAAWNAKKGAYAQPELTPEQWAIVNAKQRAAMEAAQQEKQAYLQAQGGETAASAKAAAVARKNVEGTVARGATPPADDAEERS